VSGGELDRGGHGDYQTAKLAMWLFLLTEITLFGGLFISYAYMWSRYPHEFHAASGELQSRLGVTNTVVLLTSSLTMVLSLLQLQRGEKKKSVLLITATLLFGLVFLGIKGVEWGTKFHHGLWPNSPKMLLLPGGQQVFFGLYFTMTGLHGLHVLAGMSLLAVMLVLVARGKVNRENPVMLENSGLYWHLVDIIWIFLLPLFYFAA
jgi:cytochrome c oxidase subunit III